MLKRIVHFLILVALISACTPPATTATPITVAPQPTATSEEPTQTATTSPDTTTPVAAAQTDTPAPLMATPTPTTAPPTPVPTFAPLDDFQKGMGFYTTFRGNFLLPDVRWVMEEQIKSVGATWIIIIFDCLQEPEVSPEIDCQADFAPTEEGVINVIQAAHENGLRVFLKPQIFGSVDVSTYMDMSNLDQETYWDEWFDNYTEFILHYAQMAKDYDVDLFGVGSELHGVAHFTDEWREVIAEVRQVYPGPLTYAATSYELDMDFVQFWDDLDYIGVDAYWALSDSKPPTVEELVEGWREPAALLDRLYETWQKPIIFTEIGYRNAEGSIADDDPQWVGVDPVDMELQANAYEAVFQVFGEKPWWQGVYWFGWEPNHLQGGPYDIGWSAQAKPAENVLRSHYGAPPRLLEDSFIIPEAFQNEDAMILFDDARGAGWYFDTWDSGHKDVFLDLSNESFVHSGSKAIAVVLDSAGGLAISFGSPVFRKYDYLEFYVNLGPESKHTLYIFLIAPDRPSVGPGTHTMLGNYAEVDRTKPLPLNEWFLVRIPLSELNRGGMNANTVAITNYGTVGEPSSVFYLDDIRLVREGD